MERFTIYKDNYADSTVVSNRFIDDYMKDANDAQLKIYLFLIRMMDANLPTSVSEIADKFNHTEKDVLRALKYWEKNKLLSLDYDANKALVGIHLQDLSLQPTTSNPISVSPALSLVKMVPPGAGNVSSVETSSDRRRTPLPKVALETTVEDAEQAFLKPSYSLDQLRAFKEQEEMAELFFIAESYLGKTLSPSDMKSILYCSDRLHFSNDLIDYLIQYCVDRGKKDFKYIEAVALNWAKEGVTTPKQAERFSSKYDKSVYAIMKELGKNGSPTAKEMEFINRWTKEYGFTLDIIFEACQRTVLATDKHRFEYAEGILGNWKKENVHHKADIQKIDEQYQKRRAAKPASNNKFNQFPQQNYDFDALERELLSN